MGCLCQALEHNHILGNRLTTVVSHRTQHVVLHQAMLPRKVRTYALLAFATQETFRIIDRIVVQEYRVAVAIGLDRCPTSSRSKTIGPRVRDEIDHRVFLGRNVVGAVHVVDIVRLLPRRDQTLVIEGANLVDTTIALLGLATSRIVVAAIDPLELATQAGLILLGQTHLGLHEQHHPILAPATGRVEALQLLVEARRTPGTILAIEQLRGPRELLAIGKQIAAIRTAPILHDVPIRPHTAVAGGHRTHRGRRGIHLADDSDTLLGKITRQHTLVLQAPHHHRRGVSALLNPTAQHQLEILAKLGRVVPNMSRKLRPKEDAVLIPIALIVQMVWLMRIAEGIETGCTQLLDTGSHLLVREGVALTKLVLIFANTVDEGRHPIDIETPIAILTEAGPREATNAVRGRDLVRRTFTAIAFDHRGQRIEIGSFGRPKLGLLDYSLLLDDLRLSRLERHLLDQAEGLAAVGVREFIDHLNRLAVIGVVLHLGTNMHRAIVCLVPDVHTKRLDANLVRNLKLHRTEDAERLRTLAKAHLRRATSAHPRHVGNQRRMLGLDLQAVLARGLHIVGHIEREDRATHRMATQIVSVERDRSVGADTLKVQEGAFALQGRSLETFLIMGRAVQVAMQQLAIAIIIVPIVGHSHRLRPVFCPLQPGGPPRGEFGHLTAFFALGSRERDLRSAHRAARSDRDTALIVVIDGTIEVIDHPVVFHDKTLVGK